MNTREIQKFERTGFLHPEVNRALLAVNMLLAIAYFIVITFFLPRGNYLLFGLLIGGEVFHLWQLLTFCMTVWHSNEKITARFNKTYLPAVDVFITVAGEPVDIVAKTVMAVKTMNYDDYNIYILNDGLVANKGNWPEIEQLAKDLKVDCITRIKAGGAKSGNINHGLSRSKAPFIAIFDADHAPWPNFLKKMVGYFDDEKVAFVQSPQFYKNRTTNYVTGSAWEQQELFYGPICRGKANLNATFMCGTNLVIRRDALLEVGGMNETNIAEDFVTSLAIHEHGWKSVYVPEVLAEGLAPEDFSSYNKQQFRWAKGSLEIIFKKNVLFNRNLSWPQKIQYLASASYYLSGLVVVMNALLPLIFFFTGKVPLTTSTMTLAAVFLPYIFLTLYTLSSVSNYSFTFRAIAFSMGAFAIHLKALFYVLIGRKSAFVVTAKKKVSGSFVNLVVPHLVYVAVSGLGIGMAIARFGFSASVLANISWALFNVAIFSVFIYAALGDVALAYEEKLGLQPVKS